MKIIHTIKKKKGSTYISVTFEKTHKTPCHESPHGSPPRGSHLSRGGNSSATYKLFIAATVNQYENKINKNNNPCYIHELIKLNLNKGKLLLHKTQKNNPFKDLSNER